MGVNRLSLDGPLTALAPGFVELSIKRNGVRSSAGGGSMNSFRAGIL